MIPNFVTDKQTNRQTDKQTNRQTDTPNLWFIYSKDKAGETSSTLFTAELLGINAISAIRPIDTEHIEQSQSDFASEISNFLYVDNVLLEGRTVEELI
uniref:Transcriptional regulator n=1 Tax=Haemonchus contortus TaxID=6289 RepID=A0A7I5EB88_HAECO